MAEKIEIEKPVASKELAEAFEENKNNPNLSFRYITDPDNYLDVPENTDIDAMTCLLSEMYILGYEVEKPKLKYIRLNLKSKIVCGSEYNYLHLIKNIRVYELNDKSQTNNVQTQFTQEEVDNFLKDEPEGTWVVEEVED